MFECIKELIWHDIPNYEGHYKINVIGEVKSIKFCKERIMKQCLRAGYPFINLLRDGKRNQCHVHRLMIDTFYKPKGEYVCRHLDGNPKNNVLSNLVPGTNSENQLDRRRHGTAIDNRGERCGTSKLKNENILDIREFAKTGMSENEMAERYGVARQSINRIINRKTWIHI